MTFDDTNEEYPDADQSTDARICPYCKTRPLVNRHDATTCGDRECKKTYQRKRAWLKRSHANGNMNAVYPGRITQSTDARTCPYCDERPLVNRHDAATCGDRECKKIYRRERAWLKGSHANGDMNAVYPRRITQPTDDRICPYCDERPLTNRHDATTCGDRECKKIYQRERARLKRGKEILARGKPRTCPYCNERPLVNRHDAATCTDDHCRTTHSRTRAKIRGRINYQRPEVKARAAMLARLRRLDPAYKSKMDDYFHEYYQRPHVKAKRREKSKRPYMREWFRKYHQRSYVKELKLLRGKPYPRGWGGPKRRWEMQRRQCAMGWSEFDGRSYRAVSKHFETDHLVAVALLNRISVTDKLIVNTLENIWVITAEKNRGTRGKFDTPLHRWLDSIDAPAPVVECGRQWYESVVAVIVAKQQAIDPSYELTDDRRAILGLDSDIGKPRPFSTDPNKPPTEYL